MSTRIQLGAVVTDHSSYMKAPETSARIILQLFNCKLNGEAGSRLGFFLSPKLTSSSIFNFKTNLMLYEGSMMRLKLSTNMYYY